MSPTRSNHKSRKSIRMPTFDYSLPGAYFVTIMTFRRQPIFGSLLNDHIHLSPLGELASSVWIGLPSRFSEVDLDEFIVMPNHFHGILIIKDERNRPISDLYPSRLLLGTLIGTYKSIVTRFYHVNSPETCEPVWQRNYYEHIIRDNNELDQIRQYIQENPVRKE